MVPTRYAVHIQYMYTKHMYMYEIVVISLLYRYNNTLDGYIFYHVFIMWF